MQYNFSNFKIELKKAGEFLSKEYSQLSTGRASPMVLDGVSVEIYGAYQPIKNIASINIEDPKTLRIAPWDKGQIKDIEKAINTANLGLSVATDDMGIRVIFPQLTTETRQTLVKVLKAKMEDAKIVVRKERERVLDDVAAMEKDGKMNEDERFGAKEDIQKLVVEANNNLEAIFEKKEIEVLG